MTRSRRWRPLRSNAMAIGMAIASSACARLAFGADDEAAARALFNEGRRLAAAGDYAEACPKFEDSYRLDPGIGTSFNWADCLEHLGRTASAWARFLDVAAATHVAGQPDRERVARARAAALEPQLARLTIVVDAPLTGLVIKRDANVVGQAAWSVAVPVDPGPHAIEAGAPHKKSWSTTVDIPAKPGVVSVEIPPLGDAPNPVPAPVVSGPTGAFVVPAPDRASHEPARRALSASTIGAAVLGVAGLTVGTVFELELQSTNGELKEICVTDPNSCAPQEVARYNSLHRDAVNDLTYASIGFGMGGAALLTAAYLWWRSAPEPQHSAESEARFLAAPWAGAGLFGFCAIMR